MSQNLCPEAEVHSTHSCRLSFLFLSLFLPRFLVFFCLLHFSLFVFFKFSISFFYFYTSLSSLYSVSSPFLSPSFYLPFLSSFSSFFFFYFLSLPSPSFSFNPFSSFLPYSPFFLVFFFVLSPSSPFLAPAFYLPPFLLSSSPFSPCPL